MIQHGPYRHRHEHSQQGHEMKGDNEDDTDQEEHLYDRLGWVEGEGRPRSWLSRTVVASVQPSEERGVVKQPMDNVKVCILENEHRSKAGSQIPESIFA
jgi:hypothetical protein